MKIRLALAQVNPTVGDLKKNRDLVLEYYQEAKEKGADIVIFPELVIPGYPPEDILLKPNFIRKNFSTLQEIVDLTGETVAVVGFVDYDGDDIYNAAAIVQNGKIIYKYHKVFLPNYGVFDENRYFKRGIRNAVFSLGSVRIGVNICEDIWYPNGPGYTQALIGNAQLLINISSSPYEIGKEERRKRMLATRASDYGVYLAYTNLVGGQDELVFDGNSYVFDPTGKVLLELPAFREYLGFVDINIGEIFRARLHDPRRRKIICIDGENEKIDMHSAMYPEDLPKPEIASPPSENKEAIALIYKALVTGVRDYVRKNGFKKVIIGLSGGIDSSLTAVIAVDALGKENVVGVSMPSRFTSTGTKSDARKLAENLGIEFYEIPIENIFKVFLDELEPYFKGKGWDITEENVQARVRGVLLMALSNKFGYLVLSTGNKSELSMGYCTLYGDMVGGFNVLKDVLKTRVYALSEYVNRLKGKEIIPKSVIERPPSAELRPDQKDEDTLPPYEILDKILIAYVEEDKSFEEIVGMGLDPETVKRVIMTVDRNEYKRRQGAPGIKITVRAFGKDRRMPITNAYRDI